MSSDDIRKKNKELNVREIKEILPHRYPFLLIDKIIDYDLEKESIIGQKNITANEEFFQGHFPGMPIMPGVLILESLAQTGAVLVHLKLKEELSKLALLINIKDAKFRQSVVPGDVLVMEAEAIHIGRRGGKIKAVAKVDGAVVADAEMGFALVGKEKA